MEGVSANFGTDKPFRFCNVDSSWTGGMQILHVKNSGPGI